MKVHIKTDKFYLTPCLREHLERKLQFSFSGVHNNILLVVVRMHDLSGPVGGRDMMCRILVTIPGCPEVDVSEVHEDMFTAIDFAAQRAVHRATRLLLQKRQARNQRRAFVSVM